MTTAQKLDILQATTALWADGVPFYFFQPQCTETVYYPTDLRFRVARVTVSCRWCGKVFDSKKSARRLFCSLKCANLRHAASRKDVSGYPLVQVRIERDQRGFPIAPPRIEKLKKEKMDAWT